MKKIRTLPRANIYVSFSDLVHVFFKILTGRLSKTEKVKEFEFAFGKYYGREALALPHARIALYYILKNLNLPEKSEVIMTPVTIADMVNMIHLQGLNPVFCDLGKLTYNIDYEELEKKITGNTKALFITHLNGFATDMDRVLDIVSRHNLILIEDCSQVFGAKFKGKYLGTFGHAAIFSLSLLKTCSTLFGGMIISDNAELLKKIKNDTKDFPLPSKTILLSSVFKNMIISMAFNRKFFGALTYQLIRLMSVKIDKFMACNPKIPLRTCLDAEMLTSYTDIQAEMGLKKLKTVDAEDEKRIKTAKVLLDKVSPGVKAYLPKLPKDAKNVYWRIPLRVKDPKHFLKYMINRGIDTFRTNLVLCSQEYDKYRTDTPEAFLSKFNSVFIPIHSDFKEDDMIYVAEVLNDYEKSGFLS